MSVRQWMFGLDDEPGYRSDSFAVDSGSDRVGRARDIRVGPLDPPSPAPPEAAVGAPPWALDWPSSYEDRDPYPEYKGLDWMSGAEGLGLQGVTHDETHWYFTTKWFLWKVPVGHDLRDNFGIPDFTPAEVVASCVREPGDRLVRAIPESLGRWIFTDDTSWRDGRPIRYNHFGDLDHHDGYLFVPMEGERPHRVACFRAEDLAFVGSAEFPLDVIAGSCAINPVNGLLYAMGPDSPATLQIFDVTDLKRGIENLRRVGSVGLRVFGNPYHHGTWHQGGAFSPGGHFYFSCGRSSGDSKGVRDRPSFDHWNGVLAFSLLDRGELMWYAAYPNVFWDEIEGITVWDLEYGTAPGVRPGEAPGISGQVHLLIRNYDILSADDLRFWHFGVDERDVLLV